MKYKVKAWIEEDKIKCASQMCDVKCPRFRSCEGVIVDDCKEIKEDYCLCVTCKHYFSAVPSEGYCSKHENETFEIDYCGFWEADE